MINRASVPVWGNARLFFLFFLPRDGLKGNARQSTGQAKWPGQKYTPGVIPRIIPLVIAPGSALGLLPLVIAPNFHAVGIRILSTQTFRAVEIQILSTQTFLAAEIGIYLQNIFNQSMFCHCQPVSIICNNFQLC